MTEIESKQPNTEEIDLFDKEMKYLEKEIKSKRKQLESVRGFERVKNTKFVIDMSQDNTEQKEDQLDPDNINYSFGQKFYFDEKDKYKQFQWSLSTPYDSHWYIMKKYDNLKDEIIKNKIFALNVTQYNLTYASAKRLLEYSQVLREYIQKNVDKADKRFYPHVVQKITVEHIVSILLYCNYSDLSYNFSKGFRKLNNKESDNEFKQRKREFYHWAKILIETVESFGVQMRDSKINIFYTGISQPVVFHSFVEHFYCPTSTSRQFAVAMIFAAENGVILELEKMHYARGHYLKFFNCSLLSCYANEDERLFIGGYGPLQVHNIRTIKDGKNYSIFINAMTKFNTILRGQIDHRHICNKQDKQIIDNLIKHELSVDGYLNKFPVYVNDMFHQFVTNMVES
eukprot:488527_1